MITPDKLFAKVALRSVSRGSKPLDRFSKWSVSGVGVLLALLIPNIKAVASVVDRPGLRWGIYCFVASLILGVLSKYCGLIVQMNLELVKDLEPKFFSPAGQQLIGGIENREQAIIDISSAFVWPASWFAKRSGLKALDDFGRSEKLMVKWFCWQAYFLMLHIVMAGLGAFFVAYYIW